MPRKCTSVSLADAGIGPVLHALNRRPAAEAASEEDDEMDEEFTGPWPMFDDLLASVVEVAERRIASDLRGDAARHAIRDFSLALYKELLANLGEVVEEDEDEDG